MSFHLAVTGLSGAVDETDVFFVDTHGTLRMTMARGGGPWPSPFQLGPPGLFPPGAGVATSLLFESVKLDVFVVDRKGSLNSVWRWIDVGNPAFLGGRELITRTRLFPPGAPLAASPQFGIPGQVDVFLVNNKGTLDVAWRDPEHNWNGPLAISEQGVFPRKAGVAVSKQFGIADQTDVFAIDHEGALNVAWVVGAGTWHQAVRISRGGLFPPGAPVVASNQFGIPDQTDVFVIDGDGALNVAWVNGGGIWNGPVRVSLPGVFPPGAHLAVSNQFGVPNQTDVFAIANNGGLHVCWVVGAGNWNGPVQISPSRHFAPGAPLAVSNQFGSPNQTDVFGFAENRALHVAWVFGADAWNGPVQIAPPVYPVITITVWGDLGRFVEVSGRWFTPNAAVTLDYNIQGNSPHDLIGTHTVMSNAEGHFVHAIPITFPDDIQWIAVDARDLASGAAGNVYFG